MISRDPALKAIEHSHVQQDPKNAIFFSPTRETKSYVDPVHHEQKKIHFDNCRIEKTEE